MYYSLYYIIIKKFFPHTLLITQILHKIFYSKIHARYVKKKIHAFENKFLLIKIDKNIFQKFYILKIQDI